MSTTVILDLQDLTEYQCAVCMELMTEPMQITPCGHLFCAICVKKLKTSDDTKIRCPTCRSWGSAFLDARLKREINNRVIQCPKCEKELEFRYLNKHLSDDCLGLLADCILCGETYPVSQFCKHIEICPKYYIGCDTCSTIILRQDYANHKLYYCNNCVTVECKICGKNIEVLDFHTHYTCEHVGKQKTRVIQLRKNYKYNLVSKKSE